MKPNTGLKWFNNGMKLFEHLLIGLPDNQSKDCHLYGLVICICSNSYLSLSRSISLYLSISISLTISLSLSLHLSLSLSLYLSISISLYLSLFLSLYRSISISLYLYLYLSLYLYNFACLKMKMSNQNLFKKTFFYIKPVIFGFFKNLLKTVH